MRLLTPLSYTCKLTSPFFRGFWEEKDTKEHEIRSCGRKDLVGPQGNVPASAAWMRFA